MKSSNYTRSQGYKRGDGTGRVTSLQMKEVAAMVEVTEGGREGDSRL